MSAAFPLGSFGVWGSWNKRKGLLCQVHLANCAAKRREKSKFHQLRGWKQKDYFWPTAKLALKCQRSTTCQKNRLACSVILSPLSCHNKLLCNFANAFLSVKAKHDARNISSDWEDENVHIGESLESQWRYSRIVKYWFWQQSRSFCEVKVTG